MALLGIANAILREGGTVVVMNIALMTGVYRLVSNDGTR